MTFSYKINYDNPIIRGQEEPRPWDIVKLLKDLGGSDKSLLDIGCGSGAKLVKIAPSFAYVAGLDPNISLLNLGKERMYECNIQHFDTFEGTAQRLPFENSSFDVVTSMVAFHDVQEVYRVLKPGGWALIESLGELDKRTLKEFFKDRNGESRGQLSYLEKGAIKNLNHMAFNYLFDETSVVEGFWKSYFSIEELKALLSSTPIIRNFDLTIDDEALKEVGENLITDKGIELLNHRVLIKARK